jgi:catecholate siderophore receptor
MNRSKPSGTFVFSKPVVLSAVNAIMMAGTLRAQLSGTATPAPASGDAPITLGAVTVEDAQANAHLASPKYTESILDTPQTMVAITPEVYEPQGAATLSDVLRNTPGITFFAGEGGSANRTGGDSFYLRGFDTSNSIFIDGVRDEGDLVHDTFNFDQVDVIKGPSAENGRGGTAGYINLETKMPKAAASEEGQFSYGFDPSGADAFGRATIDLNRPLADSRVAGTAVRLNLLEQDGGVTGRKLAENNRWGVAPSLALGLGTPTRAFFAYQHEYEHNLPDYGLPGTAVAGLAPPAVPGGASFFSPGVNPANFYGFAHYDYEHVTNDALTARVEHDLSPGVTLSNQTREDETERRVESTSPSGSVTAAPAGDAALTHAIYQTRNEILSNQTNLSADFATGPVSHDLTTGLELSRETADNPTWAIVPPGVANPAYLVSIYAPDNFPGALLNYTPHRTGADTDTAIDTEALYAFDTIKAARFWEVTGGVRLEHYDVHELSYTAASPALAATPGLPTTGATPATAATAAAAAVAPGFADLVAGQTTLSGKAALVFKPAPDGRLYLSYDSSVRPPGTSGATNTLSTTATSADNPLLVPEKAKNYETGVKWGFLQERLEASLALFRSVNSGVPSTDPISGLVDQTSSQTVQGVEAGVAGKITPAWLLFAGYSQMEAKVSTEISTNAQGLTLPLLPKESGSLWTTYAFPGGLTVGGGTQYIGETARLQATSAPTATTFSNQVPSYWLVNGMVSYSFNRHLTLRLNLNNLANREYIASLNNNGYRVNLGAPRAFLFSAVLRY